MMERHRIGAEPAALPHLTEAELATRWRRSPRTLERWRAAGTGPVWLRLNGRVLYRVEDVLAFEAARRQTGMQVDDLSD
jgi:hypothetical protein